MAMKKKTAAKPGVTRATKKAAKSKQADSKFAPKVSQGGKTSPPGGAGSSDDNDTYP